MTNPLKPFEEIQNMIENLRLQGLSCFISNTAYSFAGGRRTNLTPNGEWAVTFMQVGDYMREPDYVHKNLRHAVLKAIEKVNKEIAQQKTSTGEAS